jgi:hypothetical protein
MKERRNTRSLEGDGEDRFESSFRTEVLRAVDDQSSDILTRTGSALKIFGQTVIGML